LVPTAANRIGADHTRSALWPARKNFVASLSQIAPIAPVLPTQPTQKSCAVNNLRFDSFHGVGEVIGSTPTSFNRNAGAMLRRFEICSNRDNGNRGSDQSRTKARGRISRTCINTGIQPAPIKGLQNLYTPVRSRPAPPKFSPKFNIFY